MPGTNDWNESLCGCLNDCGSCCYGFFCLSCLFGSNAKKISGHNCVIMCCLYSILTSCYLCWLPHLFERQSLREKYNLRENPSCGDCPTTLCCGPCALCQEAREIKSRKNIGAAYTTSDPTVVSQPVPVQRGVYPDSHRNY
ncbi:unnamed protein product [Rotaria sp. Silwood1]|nr:unnamed protein product [Rotaria sp. Silwood1]CAF3604121.1 unnamed protein product [Rotaria sp. Silwood1]CAF3644329.1 unnamed protein product [Rotaria sp. Silwood1]CAF3671739.1 unnamed protein product [Rotaria sp. Silwood1]CAF4610438.1 unnamed protein product [Rotaria sp. Silwood1]